LQIEYEKDAAKYIQAQDKPTKQRLKTAIEKLPDGDVKKLQGYKNDYRLRVGDLRVLYSVNGDIITIKDVLPRGQAYKRL
jgi:mRNA-degrading endonuclease RelE of RelBE toxin-antitoxin system